MFPHSISRWHDLCCCRRDLQSINNRMWMWLTIILHGRCYIRYIEDYPLILLYFSNIYLRFMLNSWIYPVIVLEYDCSRFHCFWTSSYIQGQDWDYYSKTDGDCNKCKQRCTNDIYCGAIECGNNYCSWWKNGKCKVGDSDDSNTRVFTCRRPPRGIFRWDTIGMISNFEIDSLNKRFNHAS